MKKVITNDGSVSYFNEEFQEHYHSITGAKEEALEKHAKIALSFFKEMGMPERKIRILDFCFGLGYNSIVFIEKLRKSNKNIEIEVIGVDNDLEIINEGKKLFRELLDKYVYNDDKVDLRVEVGDAKEVVKKLDNMFDVCFFDPFSPTKCPELWNEDIFNDVFKLMKKNSILTTYSCARKVRENLKKAGFIVKDGPYVKRYAPSTIAIKNEKNG